MSKELTISNLDQHLKPLQIDSVTTPIELSTEAIRMNKDISFQKDVTIEGDLNVLGSTGTIILTEEVTLESRSTNGNLSIYADAILLSAVNYEGTDATIAIAATTGNDAKVSFYDGSTSKWHLGNDSDDSHTFKIGTGATMGSNTKLDLDTSGNLTVTGEFVSSNMLYGSGVHQFYGSGGNNSNFYGIQVLANGVTTLSTVSGSADASDFKIDANGDITLDSSTGEIFVKDDGGNYTPSSDYHIATKKYVDDNHPIQVAEVTVSDSECNALHTTAKTIVAAQGADKVIFPTSAYLFVEHGGTPQGASGADMFISWNGGTTSSTTIFYLRRFFYGETSDRIYKSEIYTGEAGQSLTAGDNQPLTIKLDSAVTTDSIDSIKVVVSYFVYDNG